jgi:hypothetical protein
MDLFLWEATIAPPCYSMRVTKEQMEQEVMTETKKALEELREIHPQLFTGQPLTPTKKSGIKFYMSKLSPMKGKGRNSIPSSPSTATLGSDFYTLSSSDSQFGAEAMSEFGKYCESTGGFRSPRRQSIVPKEATSPRCNRTSVLPTSPVNKGKTSTPSSIKKRLGVHKPKEGPSSRHSISNSDLSDEGRSGTSGASGTSENSIDSIDISRVRKPLNFTDYDSDKLLSESEEKEVAGSGVETNESEESRKLKKSHSSDHTRSGEYKSADKSGNNDSVRSSESRASTPRFSEPPQEKPRSSTASLPITPIAPTRGVGTPTKRKFVILAQPGGQKVAGSPAKKFRKEETKSLQVTPFL